MKKIVIWGVGLIGKQQAQKHNIRPDIVCFVDSNENLWGGAIDNIPIISPNAIKDVDYDYVIICVADKKAVCEIELKLLELNVPKCKILDFSCIDKIVFCGNKEQINKFAMLHYYDYDVLAYVDINISKENYMYYGFPTISLDDIKKISYFGWLIVDCDTEYDIYYQKFIENGISPNHIINFSKLVPNYSGGYIHYSRYLWIQNYAEWINTQNLYGNVAECGVFQGECAKFINEFFPKRKLYLFDTFDGFREEDIKIEVDLNKSNFYDSYFYSVIDCYADTSINLVMEKMNYPKNIIIKKGYFPDSARDVDDKFCFVNLDMDLYKPTLEALHFFWDKVVECGCILIHDYFHPELLGISEAVKDFEEQRGFRLNKITIGDRCSIAILK